MIPKSEKLNKEEAQMATAEKTSTSTAKKAKKEQSEVVIRKVNTLNEFVAVRLFEVESDLALPDERRFRNEGIIVGVGPGVPDGSGGRCPSQLSIGDVVLIQEKNVLTYINDDKYPYDGAKIALMSERNLLCKLKPVPYRLVD